MLAAVSLKKSSEIVLVSKPFVNFLDESPIAVTSSSSNTRLIVALVTWSESATELRVTTTPFDRNTAIAYSSLFSVVGVCVFVSFFGASVICPILIRKAISSSVRLMLNSTRLVLR